MLDNMLSPHVWPGSLNILKNGTLQPLGRFENIIQKSTKQSQLRASISLNIPNKDYNHDPGKI